MNCKMNEIICLSRPAMRLPRHVQSFLVAQRARSIPSTSFRRYPPPRLFHASSRIHNEPPKSPFQTFVEVLREELRKNRELQDNVKQLQGDVDKFQDSEALKRARDVYERARVHIQVPVPRSQSCSTSFFSVDFKYQRKPPLESGGGGAQKNWRQGW